LADYFFMYLAIEGVKVLISFILAGVFLYLYYKED